MSFINNSATSCGGALYLKSTAMSINSDVNMTLTHNHVATPSDSVETGEAMFVKQSTVTVKTGVLLLIARNTAYRGGVYLRETSTFLIGHMKFCLKIILLWLEVVLSIWIVRIAYLLMHTQN